MNEGLLLPMAFGNQTISSVKLRLVGSTKEIHGFASLLRNRFAFIVQSSASKEQCRKYGELKLPERNLIVNTDYTPLNGRKALEAMKKSETPK